MMYDLNFGLSQFVIDIRALFLKKYVNPNLTHIWPQVTNFSG